jgi:hypothetical protein
MDDVITLDDAYNVPVLMMFEAQRPPKKNGVEVAYGFLAMADWRVSNDAVWQFVPSARQTC